MERPGKQGAPYKARTRRNRTGRKYGRRQRLGRELFEEETLERGSAEGTFRAELARRSTHVVEVGESGDDADPFGADRSAFAPSPERIACVDLPAFPLQLLLRRHPDWRGLPAVVVDRDHPQGLVLWANEAARARRVLPGLRYAAALSLERDLRASEVSMAWVELAVSRVVRRLRYFSPHVEPSRDEPGVFWIDASGLERLYDSLHDWAREVRADLVAAGFTASLAVGFSRFGSYALARERRACRVLTDPQQERVAARRVPLDRLALPPKQRDALDRLGICTLGDWIDLPEDGVAARFGEELQRLHRIASGSLQDPLQPEPDVPLASERRLLDHAERSVAPLMYVLEEMLDALRAQLFDRCQAAAALKLVLKFESGEEHVEIVRPAAPTRDRKSLLELLRLRLGSLRLPGGVEEVTLVARGESRERGQLDLFAEKPRRDLEAANRALARVRAQLGDDAVARAELVEGHLPEGRFRWERLVDARGGATEGGRADRSRPAAVHQASAVTAATAARAGWLDATWRDRWPGHARDGALPAVGWMVASDSAARVSVRGDEEWRADLGLLRPATPTLVPAGEGRIVLSRCRGVAVSRCRGVAESRSCGVAESRSRGR